MEPSNIYTYDRLSNFVDTYKSYVDDTTRSESNPATKSHKYIHFEASPDAIATKPIGRFGANIFKNIASWKQLPRLNGIDAWKMNLGKKMVSFKAKEFADVKSSKRSGLACKTNTFDLPSGLVDITKYNVDALDLLAKVAYQSDEQTQLAISIPNDLLPNIMALFSDSASASASAPASAPSTSTSDAKIVSLDWTGIFLNDAGVYEMSFASINCLFFVWVGDKSVCEFTSANSDINNSVSSYLFSLNSQSYLPIRIQCLYISTSPPGSFELSIIKKQLPSTNTTIDVTQTLFYTNIPPVILYSAFVSNNQQDFLKGVFQCYTLLSESNGELILTDRPSLPEFYKQFRLNLMDVTNLKYDYNTSNRMSYGTIPSINTQYTISETSNNLPFAFSIYRLTSDQRFGKTYQVTAETNTNSLFPMKQFGDSIVESSLNYADNYSEKTGFYPTMSLNPDQALNKSGLDCKEDCNNNPNCSYYFTFTEDGKSKCILNSIGGLPEFSRVPPQTTIPIDNNSSSLFLRNYQLDISGSANCGTLERPSNVIPITSVSNYSTTYQYAHYELSSDTIDDPQQVGICGSPAYAEKQNDAYNILFKDANYYKDGRWAEGFDSNSNTDKPKYTHAVADTSDAIRINLKNEQIYEHKMKSIDEKQKKLEKNLIPKFRETRTIMENDPKYDYNGDSLLYFRTKPIPNIRERDILDNNEQFVTSQLTLSLGAITAATLIVFAVLLARE